MNMSRSLKLSVLFGVVSLAGCATHAYYQRAANSWRGTNVQQFQTASHWGYCTHRIAQPQGVGGYVCSYVSRSRTYIPGYESPSQTRFTPTSDGGYVSQTTQGYVVPGRVETNVCRTNFLFSANNMLVGVRASGGCSTTKSGMREMCKPSAPCAHEH